MTATLAPPPRDRVVLDGEPDVTDVVADLDFAGGGEEALRAAWELHGALVHGLCRRAVGEHRAPDVTQEVFIAAWKNRHRFDPARGTLAGWLVGIARNKIMTTLRTGSRQLKLAEKSIAHAGRDLDLDPSEVDHLAEQLLVRDALDILPERSRHAVELAFWGGMSHSEIAERTELPLGTVKSDIRRALHRLRDHLEGSEVGLDA